jgi:hypothetical protein
MYLRVQVRHEVTDLTCICWLADELNEYNEVPGTLKIHEFSEI